MVDEIKTALALAEKGSDAAISFLGKIAGPAAEECGLLLQDKVKSYRFKNQVKMLAKAKEMLDEAGVTPKAVHLKTLLPLLDGAALEEDEDLSIKWASLLANAATPNPFFIIYPSYPHILSQLSPRDATLLDAIYDLSLEIHLKPGRWMERGASRESILKHLRISQEEFDLITDNLIRLGLCSGLGARLTFTEHSDKVFQLKNKEVICMTQLGYEFVTACRSPPKKIG